MFISVEDPALRVLIRILLVPVIAGISYEIIRLAGNNGNNILVKVISAPGMWLQTLTTKEPTEDMVEVAIKSVEAVFDWKSFQERESRRTTKVQEEVSEVRQELEYAATKEEKSEKKTIKARIKNEQSINYRLRRRSQCSNQKVLSGERGVHRALYCQPHQGKV